MSGYKKFSTSKRALPSLLIGFVLLFIVISSCIFSTNGAHAMGVSPPTVVIGAVNPGDTKIFQVTVVNPVDVGQPPLEVTTTLKNYVKDENGDLSVYSDPTTPDDPTYNYSMASWIKPLSDTSFVLAAQEQRKMTFQVNVPQQAEPGEKYCAVAFTGTPPATPGTVQFQDTVLAQAFVVVGGQGNVALKIDPPKLSKSWLCATDIKYEVNIYNAGNIHLDIRNLYLNFYNHGNLIAQKDLGTPLLLPPIPGNEDTGRRVFTGDINLPSGWKGYDVRVETDTPIQAQSDNSKIGTFPLWLFITIIVVIVLLLLALLYFFYRKHKKKKGGRNGKGKHEKKDKQEKTKPSKGIEGTEEGSPPLKQEKLAKNASSPDNKKEKEKEKKGKSKIPPPTEDAPEQGAEEV